MQDYQIGLLTTFLLGIFILIGALIALLVNKKDKIIDFSIGLAFGVIVTLILTDLLPEVFESFGLKKFWLFIIFSFIGFGILKLLDKFVPDHHSHGHHHCHLSKKENSSNLVHIGVVTTLALFLHNIIEGMAVYSTSLTDSSLTFLLAIGVGFHNIPLGMVVASSFYHSTNNIKKTIISVLLVSVSTFFGGLIMYLFNLTQISEIVLGILLSITLGMLLYIIVDELFPRIVDTKNKKVTYIGITIGVVALIISMLIG